MDKFHIGGKKNSSSHNIMLIHINIYIYIHNTISDPLVNSMSPIKGSKKKQLAAHICKRGNSVKGFGIPFIVEKKQRGRKKMRKKKEAEKNRKNRKKGFFSVANKGTGPKRQVRGN